jgi:drug/metabolite transporter (DMT)-like permease
MSDEGVRLVSRLALVIVLILVTAMVRTVVGPSKKRGRIMGIGAFCGLASGVLIAMPVSRSLGVDVSAIAACIGIVVGWAVSWHFAKQIPREAP